MPDGLDIFEIGVLLGNAKFYVGGSMHGVVTSLACGHPAGNVVTWTATKLQDLHGARMQADCFINHWGKLPELLYRLNREAEEEACCQHNELYAEYMRDRLSRELDELCNQIKEREQRI